MTPISSEQLKMEIRINVYEEDGFWFWASIVDGVSDSSDSCPDTVTDGDEAIEWAEKFWLGCTAQVVACTT